MAGAVNVAAGGRDQETTLATEVAFLDSDTNKVVAQVVRRGAGENLENDKTMMTAVDAKGLLDGRAKDVNQALIRLKTGTK